MTTPVPEGIHSVTPIFVFKDARKAMEFCMPAFGAQAAFVRTTGEEA
jgi:uncharacterized glyoxalase superfamily protein PhnB